jgi:crossover junction endodeoxyribonuclease RuvC
LSTRILGVDPGLTRCGVGIVDLSSGRKVSLVNVSVIESPKESELAERINLIGAELEKIFDEYKPDVVAIEKVFSQQNLSSVMGTAQISGVAIYLAARRGIKVAMHTPTEVKASVTGSGRANKIQVGVMVAKLLGLTEIPKPADAADSLAIAICQAFRGGGVAKDSSKTYTPAQLAWHNAEKSAASKAKA